MRIVSNYKEYYDFLKGKYGIDPLITYERICLTYSSGGKWEKHGIYKPPFIENSNETFNFQLIAVAGTVYCAYFYFGRFYFGSEADFIPSEHMDKYNHGSPRGKVFMQLHGTPTDINEKEDCPVMLVSVEDYESEGWTHIITDVKYSADIKNPKLSDYQFGKCLEAEKCYLAISNFLAREKPVVDNRSDIQKIVGKGFDKKYSFRTRPAEKQS